MSIVSDDEERRRAARRDYEAGPHFAMWRRFSDRQTVMFETVVNSNKATFDFVRMILTTAVIIAIAVYFIRSTDNTTNPAERVFLILGRAGLVLMGLRMLWATYLSGLRFGMVVSADIASSFSLPFNATLLRSVARLVVLSVLLATVEIGIVFGNQAIKLDPKIQAASQPGNIR